MTDLINVSKDTMLEKRIQRKIQRMLNYKTTFEGNKKEIDEAIEITKAQAEMKKIEIIIPPIRFGNQMTLSLGTATLHLYYNTPSYSTSDIIIEIPEEKILIVGDIFNKGRLPWLDAQTDFTAMNVLFSPFVSDTSQIKYFMGTHGYVMEMAEVKEQLGYINQLYKEVAQQKKTGKTVEEIKQKITLKNFTFLSDLNPYFNGTDLNLHSLNIEEIWKQLSK